MSTFARVGEKVKRLLWWIAMHRPVALVIFGVMLIVPAAIIAYALIHQPLPPLDTTPIAVTPREKPKYYSLLDGTAVSDENSLKAPVTAVLIENLYPAARPQSGLKEAQVVYEAIAEGGITRFLSLYQQNKPQMVGPVRSLRMYYLDWAAPYQASIVHVGGSLFSLREIQNGQYRNIDIENHNGASWRARERAAPHNVYTKFESLDTLNKNLNFTTSEFTSFPRTDGHLSDNQNATSIDVAISSPAYNSHYDYDSANNTYKRSQGGQPHLDREQGQITPSVVITLQVKMSLIMEDGWRQDIATTGTGEAQVFQNGTVTTAVWSKADRLSPLKITDQNGKDIELNRGQTWIAAVPTSAGGVTWR